MKAITYQGMKDMKVKTMGDPKIEKTDDIIVQVTSTAICGSDLHLYHGMIPKMPPDFILGHEAMGIVQEAGKDVSKVKKGDRVIVPFPVPAVTAGFVNINYGANATILIPMPKLEPSLATVICMEDMMEGKRNT